MSLYNLPTKICNLLLEYKKKSFTFIVKECLRMSVCFLLSFRVTHSLGVSPSHRQILNITITHILRTQESSSEYNLSCPFVSPSITFFYNLSILHKDIFFIIHVFTFWVPIVGEYIKKYFQTLNNGMMMMRIVMIQCVPLACLPSNFCITLIKTYFFFSTRIFSVFVMIVPI